MSATDTATPEYLDEKQTAIKVNMTRDSLRLDRHRGVGLPYVKFGHRIRYRVADVDAYLAACTVTPGSPPAQRD